MIDRKTPLAEIVGQMSLSRSTDVSTQSWVFISVKNVVKIAFGVLLLYYVSTSKHKEAIL